MERIEELEKTFKIKREVVEQLSINYKVDKTILTELLVDILEDIGCNLYWEIDREFKIEVKNNIADIKLVNYLDNIIKQIFEKYFNKWEKGLYCEILYCIYFIMKKNTKHFDNMYNTEI